MTARKFTESGQIVVILALAIVALFGFAALAIDVGMVYSDRRYDQSAADASALAAAQTIVSALNASTFNISEATPLCGSGQFYEANPTIVTSAQTKAINQANTNGFTIISGLSTSHGVLVECIAGAGAFYNHYLVTVMISSETSASFSQIFFGGPLKNTVTAKTSVYPKHNVGYGNSVVAFKNTEDPNPNTKELTFVGGGPTRDPLITSNITLYGGGLFSNGNVGANGTVGVNVFNTAGTAILANGINYRLGTYASPGTSGFYHPTPSKDTEELPLQTYDVSGCGADQGNVSLHGNNTLTLNPGTYTPSGNNPAIKMTGGTINLNPGLYCLDGDLDISGNSGNAFQGSGVTIYMRHGRIIIGGNLTVNIAAAETTPQNGAVKGLLIYVDHVTNACNVGTATAIDWNNPCINIGGGSSQFINGTILAPHGVITYAGNPTNACNLSGSAITTQVMGWAVQLAGATDLCINFDKNKLLTIDSKMNMTQ